MQQSDFVRVALRVFPGSRVVDGDTFEAARDRVLDMLREENKHLDLVSRWVSACRVFYDLHQLHEDPQRTWAARVLDEDLMTMLEALHKTQRAEEYTSTWPPLWENKIQ